MVLDTAHGFKVRPAVAQVNGEFNPFFRFKNNTGYPCWLLLPPEVVDGEPGPVEIASHTWVEVPLRGGDTHSYVVVLKTNSSLVTVPGESDPVIIIDPPARRSR
jgi:hypothetical protein